MRQVLPFVTGMLTIFAMWLAGSKRWEAWAVGLANQGLWLATTIVFATWGLLPLTVFLTFTYARNLIRWRRDEASQSGSLDQKLDQKETPDA